MTERIVQLAVIGAAGRQGGRRLEAFSRLSGCRLKWVVDLPERREALETLARRFQCQAVTEWPTIIDDPAIDAVVICTPSDLHAAIALPALRGGKHVMIEKPLDVDLVLAEQTVALAHEQRRVLHVGMNFRHRDPVRAALALLEAGAVGIVQHVRGQNGHSQFVGTSEGHARAHFLSGNGSGPLLDLGVHLLDLGLVALGRPRIHRAFGFANHGDSLPRHLPQVETAFFVTTDQRTLSLESSYIEARPYMGSTFEIQGSMGRLRVDLASDVVHAVHAVELVRPTSQGRDGPDVEQVLRGRGLRWTDCGTRDANGVRAHWFAFTFPDDCWRNDCQEFLDTVCGPQQGGNGTEALEALRLIAAARESSRNEGHPVTIMPEPRSRAMATASRAP